jgi:hypothetical protein
VQAPELSPDAVPLTDFLPGYAKLGATRMVATGPSPAAALLCAVAVALGAKENTAVAAYVEAVGRGERERRAAAEAGRAPAEGQQQGALLFGTGAATAAAAAMVTAEQPMQQPMQRQVGFGSSALQAGGGFEVARQTSHTSAAEPMSGGRHKLDSVLGLSSASDSKGKAKRRRGAVRQQLTAF